MNSFQPAMRRLYACTTIALAVSAGSIAGCHSAFVNATVANRSGHPVRLVEVDYPSASFGTEELADGATFKYRFKVLGSGNAKISWTDSAQKDHNATGPALQEGDEGQLSVTLGPDAPAWKTALHQ